MGRPKKYTEAFVKAEAVALTKWVTTKGKSAQKRLYIKQFAIERGYTYQRCHEWATALEDDGTYTNPEFAEAHAFAKEALECKIVLGMLNGDLQTAGAIFALKNIAKWRDRAEHSVEDTTLNTLAGILAQIDGGKSDG